jgi:LPXTG-site transpeptidase (sortase) family protein
VKIGHLMRRLVGRRAASVGLVAVGSCLLVVSAASVARGAIARDTARARWAEMEAQRAARAGHAFVRDEAGWTTTAGSPVARLVIPKLDLDEVVVEGVSEESLRAGPGHMIGSALPGDSGNSVLSAHRDRHFRALGALGVGDTLVTDSDRGRVVWEVTRVRVVTADAPVLRDSSTPVLTLTTCWPIRYFGPAPDRLIVEAKVRR